MKNPLTPQQQRVLWLLACGGQDKQIASHLRISTRTVRFHIGEARRRLHCQTRPQALFEFGKLVDRNHLVTADSFRNTID